MSIIKTSSGAKMIRRTETTEQLREKGFIFEDELMSQYPDDKVMMYVDENLDGKPMVKFIAVVTGFKYPEMQELHKLYDKDDMLLYTREGDNILYGGKYINLGRWIRQ